MKYNLRNHQPKRKNKYDEVDVSSSNIDSYDSINVMSDNCSETMNEMTVMPGSQ